MSKYPPAKALADPARLAAVRRAALCDTAPDPLFVQLAQLAARSLRTPMAILSLVEADAELQLSSVGLSATPELRRRIRIADSLCERVVSSGAAVRIADVRDDPDAHARAAASDRLIIAYAAWPLTDPQGQVVGVLCVLDQVPRPWRDEELALLAELANTTSNEIELRALAASLSLSERAGRERGALLQAILDGMSELVIAVDTEGSPIAFNRAAASTLSNELLATPISTWASRLDVRRSDGTPYPYAEWPVVHALAGAVSQDVEMLVDSKGSPRVLSVNSAPLLDERGSAGGALMLVRDVTRQRKTEEELRRGAALRDTARVEFISNMSHEIRNPMNAIIGMADLLGNTQLDVSQRQYLRMLQSAGEHLLMLINNVLDLSKIEADKLEFEEIDFHLHDLIEAALEICPCPPNKPALQIVSHVSSDVPRHLIGDPHRLRQVLVNLISNAIKFTERGEIVVRVEQRPEAPAGTLRFLVTDTGIGISPEKLPLLFHNFHQADPSMSRRYGGSGLGLAISKELIERMGGAIEVTSLLGQGSSFSFWLPLTPHAEAARSTLSNLLNLSGISALVAADSVSHRLMLREMLISCHAEVDEADSLRDLLTKLERSRASGDLPRLLLLDDHMLELDGDMLVRHLRSQSAWDDLAIVWITVKRPDRTWTKSPSSSGVHVLTKPVRRRELIDAVLSVLGERPGERAISPVPVLRPALAGPRVDVLIIDDSAENRLIMKHFLDERRYRCELVDGAMAGVARVQQGRYSLVLMDLQMPGVDGFSATRAIRAHEAATGAPRTPIIAVSAHALAEHIAAARTAGCDDHLAKPFRREQLVQMVERYAPSVVAAPLVVAAAPVSPPSVVTIDPRLRDLVPAFLQGRQRDLRSIRAALDDGDFDAILVIGHTMKGIGGSYGFSYVSECGGLIEAGAAARNAALIGATAEALSAYLETIEVRSDD